VPRFVLRARDLRRPPGAGIDARTHARPWAGRLRGALRSGAFVLHYQPIVALADGCVSHHEALVRLADEPGGRLLAPAAFLPAAERHGIVCEIDRLVLARVAALLARAPTDGDARDTDDAGDTAQAHPRCVAINLSALSVTDRAMLAHVERELARHDVDPRRLVLEITETAAISDMRRARAFCAGARALGCRVALDDFGVGFGSLRYAKRLPFDYLKIDGEFVRELCSSREDRLLVAAIVELARGLDRETIAEFVGDEPTLELLRELRVDYAQGFHIGQPAALAGV
jgi:EAL domain-containing protein (putative c-di-GMP-specific phosphodiesterase class I)